MPYEFRQEEKDKWESKTWLVKRKNEQTGLTEKVEVPISELPKGYAKNIVNYLKKRYGKNKKYQEFYIEGSPKWLELNRRAGTDASFADETVVTDNDLPDSMNMPNKANKAVMPSRDDLVTNHTQDLKILVNLIDDTVKGIDNKDISLNEARDILASIEVKLNTLINK